MNFLVAFCMLSGSITSFLFAIDCLLEHAISSLQRSQRIEAGFLFSFCFLSSI